MDNEQKTFPNTIAARNGYTVSGNLLKRKEIEIQPYINSMTAVFNDIYENIDTISHSTILLLIEGLKGQLECIDNGIKSLICSIQCEEHNANLPNTTED